MAGRELDDRHIKGAATEVNRHHHAPLELFAEQSSGGFVEEGDLGEAGEMCCLLQTVQR